MKYSAIKFNDIANGDGIRISLFVSGCRIHCPGCHNQSAWNFDSGKIFTPDTIKIILKSLESETISGLSILGGEPLDKRNQSEVLKLILILRSKFKNSKSIWLFTGYTIDDLLIDQDQIYVREILFNVDMIVDGPFIESEKVLGEFRGSKNQRFIKVDEKFKRSLYL